MYKQVSRQCRSCRYIKPITEFQEIGFKYPNKPRYRRHYCRDCQKIRSRKTKVCIKCGVEKSIVEFYKEKQRKDGHRNECKACHNTARKMRGFIGKKRTTFVTRYEELGIKKTVGE